LHDIRRPADIHLRKSEGVDKNPVVAADQGCGFLQCAAQLEAGRGRANSFDTRLPNGIERSQGEGKAACWSGCSWAHIEA